MKYRVIVPWERIREYCIRHNLCDAISNAEYEDMLMHHKENPIQEPYEIKRLAHFIWTRTSDQFGYDETSIEFGILNEVAFLTIVE